MVGRSRKGAVLELRPTTFGTPPLSKGWGRPEAEINPQEDRSTQDSRQDSSLYLLLCILNYSINC
jgi:hypothetical protein